MYIGNGRIVHASRPGKPVKTDNIDLMPYAGASPPGLSRQLRSCITAPGHCPGADSFHPSVEITCRGGT